MQLTDKRKILSKYLLMRSITELAGGLSVSFMAVFFLKILSLAEYGILIAIGLVITTIMEYPAGLVTDIMGEKKAMVISYLLFACGWLAYYHANTAAEIYMIQAIFSIGVALDSGTLMAWLVSCYQKTDKELKNFKAVVGKINSIFLLFSASVGISGGLIADAFVIKDVFLLESFFALICAIVFGLVITPTKNNDERKLVKNYLLEFKRGLIDFSKNSKLIQLTFSYALIYSSYAIFCSFFWQPLAMNIGNSFLILSITNSIGILMMAFTNWITSKFTFDHKLGRISSLFILPYLLLILTFTFRSMIVVCGSLVLFEALVGLIFPHYTYLFHKELKIENRARMIGIKDFLTSIIQVISFAVTGALAMSASMQIAMLFGSLLIILGEVIIWYNVKTKSMVKIRNDSNITILPA